jgi:hypothetical protein
MISLREVTQAALFEKSAQKLLLILTVVAKTPVAQIKEVFLVLFVHKKNCFLSS